MFSCMSLISIELINHANETHLRLTGCLNAIGGCVGQGSANEAWDTETYFLLRCELLQSLLHVLFVSVFGILLYNSKIQLCLLYLFFFHPLTLASDPFIPTLLEHVSQVHTFFSCLLWFYICSLSRGVSLALLFPLRLCFGNGNLFAVCSTQYKLHVKQCATYKNKHFKQYAALSHDLITYK